jgi:hypothetical protein
MATWPIRGLETIWQQILWQLAVVATDEHAKVVGVQHGSRTYCSKAQPTMGGIFSARIFTLSLARGVI